MSALIDLTGQQFGRWVVISQAETDGWGESHWLCQCDCGNQKVVLGKSLREGRSRSCSCLQRELTSKRKLIDLVGQRSGKLIVVERAGRDKWGQAHWLCRCDCGGECRVSGYRLRKKLTKSCGCLHTLSKGEAAFNDLFYHIKKGAGERKIEWALSKEQVRIITKQNCCYCGVEPRQVSRIPHGNGDYIYNGIDRVDNDKGYTPENVVPCCGDCNFAKRKKTVEEFKEWGRRFCKHFVKEP